jgi:hypothetical protein
MELQRIGIAIGVSLLVTACAAPLEIIEQKKEIKLRVQPGPELVVDEPPTPGCNNPNAEFRKGCIIAEAGEQVVVDYRLLQHGQYRLSKFEVCPGADKRSNTNLPCTLPFLKRTEFILQFAGETAIPDGEGTVDFLKLAEGTEVHDFTLVVKNTITADYFYRIQACPDDDSMGKAQSAAARDMDGCFWTDPPIISKGVGTFSL